MEQENQTSSNRRIAKNALMLYIRMFLTMIVGLYTSRVVLATLGVEDYGIYGVVGGVVAMMGFLNASMSGATSRFLTFELGRGDRQRLSDTFSSALIVHIGIALVVFVLAETVGLWFLCNKLVIPEGRMEAAHWVYQCSILSAMLSITQAPYNASIIAHEKMDVYAYVEILNVSLKLIIVYLLVIGNFDKLKLYAVLTLAVGVTIMLIYRIYCIRRFPETHFRLVWNKSILRPLLSFSAQTVLAHGSFSLREQGNNLALNMLFGVVVNAASGIATTINGIINHFSYNVLTAFRPQIIKSYAKKDFKNCNKLINSASKYSVLLLLIIIVPFEFEAPMIIKMWLGQLPLHAVSFNRIMMLSLLTCMTNPVYVGLTATGKIKYYSYIQASLYLLCPFIIYFVCYIFSSPEIAYIIIIIAQYIAGILAVIFYNRQSSQFSVYGFLKNIIYGVIFPTIVSITLCYGVYNIMSTGFARLSVIVLLNSMVLAIITYMRLDIVERFKLKQTIRQKFRLS